MTKQERRHEYFFDLTPFSSLCINCVYFVRHYVYQGKDRFIEIDDGHCKHGMLKCRKCYDTCGHFTNRFYDDYDET